MRVSRPVISAVSAAVLLMAACLIGRLPDAWAQDMKGPVRVAPGFGRGVDTMKGAAPEIQLSLTFPAGASPKVFTRGWVFGARCLVNPGTREQADESGNVRWTGTGTFAPDRGPLSRPVFTRPGTNRITLSYVKDGRTVLEKTFTVETVDPTGYAGVTGVVNCPLDAHGCPGCPHNVSGPILSGSPNVSVNGIPAARVGDHGVHAGCCGSNTFVIKTGDPNVLIDGKPAARVGDQTQHCGGTGRIISASGNN